PAGVEAFAGSLTALGWSVVAQVTASRLLPLHAAVATHPTWPIQVDVHWAFPGFLAPADTVFEVLWSRRSTLAVARVQVPCTDPCGSAAVYGLSILRDGRLREKDLSALVERLRAHRDELRAGLAEVAERTGSTRTLSPV